MNKRGYKIWNNCTSGKTFTVLENVLTLFRSTEIVYQIKPIEAVQYLRQSIQESTK